MLYSLSRVNTLMKHQTDIIKQHIVKESVDTKFLCFHIKVASSLVHES